MGDRQPPDRHRGGPPDRDPSAQLRRLVDSRAGAPFRGGVWGGGGGPRAPKALYMPTLTAIRRNPAIRTFYARLIARGRPAKVAITACMRKLLTILNAILKSRTPWQHA